MADGIDLSQYRKTTVAELEEEREMIATLQASIDLAERAKLGKPTHRGVPARKPGAQKDNTGKRQWWLLPWEAVGLGVDVLMYGAYDAPRPDGTTGYGANNWQGIPTIDYLDAAVRHINSWRAGEWQDPASKKAHLAHAWCCITFALAQTMRTDGCS